MNVYACEGIVATPSPAENFGIVKNIQKLDVLIKVVYNIPPYFYVAKYGGILYSTKLAETSCSKPVKLTKHGVSSLACKVRKHLLCTVVNLWQA